LQRIDLYNVRSIDEPALLLDLELVNFRAEACPTLDEGFAEAAKSKAGRWVVMLDRRRRGVKLPELFEVEQTPEGTFEIAFRDWAWALDRLGVDEEDLTSVSGWVEAIMIEAIRREHPELLESGPVIFDSESEQINIIAADRKTASTVSRLLQELFGEKRRVRALARNVSKNAIGEPDES